MVLFNIQPHVTNYNISVISLQQIKSSGAIQLTPKSPVVKEIKEMKVADYRKSSHTSSGHQVVGQVKKVGKSRNFHQKVGKSRNISTKK